MHRFVALTCAFVLAFTFAFAAPAQSEGMDDVSFYVLGALSLPFGDFGDVAGLGFGGGVGAKIPFNDAVNFRGEAGYMAFGGKDFDSGFGTTEYSFSMIPVVALAEWHFDPAAAFYGLGGVGFFNMSVDVETPATMTSFGTFGGGSVSTSSSEFGLVAGGGVEVNEQVAIEGRINLISDSNQVTVNGTYTF